MVITIDPALESAIRGQAASRGIAPEALVLEVLRERFVPARPAIEPRDDWERELLAIASDYGVSLPDSALTSDELYD